MVVDDLAVGSIGNNTSLGLQLFILFLSVVRESPVLGDDDFLLTREFVLGATEGLQDVGNGGGFAAHGAENLTDIYTGNKTLGFTEGSTHSCLESEIRQRAARKE